MGFVSSEAMIGPCARGIDDGFFVLIRGLTIISIVNKKSQTEPWERTDFLQMNGLQIGEMQPPVEA